MKLKRLWISCTIIFLTLIALAAGECGLTEECVFSGVLEPLVFSFYGPIFLFSLMSIPIAILIPFVSERTFSRWKSFALVWIPISIITIMLSQTHVGEGIFSFNPYQFDKEAAAKVSAFIFTVVSLIIFFVGAFANKKQRTK